MSICTLEDEVWLVSGRGHLRQSALVHDLVSQGRTALSPLSAGGGFVFPVVPETHGILPPSPSSGQRTVQQGKG